MRIINCLIAILIAHHGLAQQVVRKVVNSPNGEREVYYVLASDKTTLHGRYLRTERTARTEGFYKNGLQDGVWTVYAISRSNKFIRVQGPFKDGLRQGMWAVYSSKKKLRTKGYYQDDMRIGFWRFYNDNGELEEEGNYDKNLRVGKWSFYDEMGNMVQEYDYTTRNVISDVSIASLQQTPFKVIDGTDTVMKLLQRPPLYIGGKAKLNKSKIIQYQMKQDSVKVEVSITIDKTGRVLSYKVAKGMGYPYDQEALFTISQLPGYWLPGILNGQPVEVQHTLVVLFKRVTMKLEPTTYYARRFRSSNIRNPWEQSTFNNQYPPMYVPPPVLSYLACKIQIL